ncbi:ABC transporter substrate-binding protein [Tranquillimonas alkanivorans]|uniref:Putative ABC transport system substrate-binding protein n=1 Tax=Tranquillimonas alkanivorans TaxID=441119 RepID=A0A1I5S6T4_9RHOB|nr:ABC transporter substrate-binding protein [Tranquillimonas alkanivorans]SFP66412.1 putative ABC transport system substrate-binding protein [Tranquillimonas alkanivorans]
MKPLYLAAALAAGVSAPVFAQDDVKTVAVSQIVEHPALDATREGLLRGLEEAGYTVGENLEFTYQTAQGNPAVASQIARKFVGDAPDVLVGISTPSAQALASATSELPVVFTAVTDPVSAKLVDKMEAPGGNVTGLSDMSPVGQHLDLMKEIKPNATRVGVVYSPGESNAAALLEMLRSEAEGRDLEIVEAAAVTSADMMTATRSIAGEVDFIYAPTDNNVASAIKTIVAVGESAGVPVFAGANTYVPEGATVGLGFDYAQIGEQTADYVVQILEGANPADMPATVASGSDLVLNLGAAEKIGLEIPQSVRDRATEVIE